MCNCKTSNRQFLFDDNYIIRESYIDPNIDRNLIRIAAQHVENVIKNSVLGKCLYCSLLEMICDQTILEDENACYQELLHGYIFNVVRYGVQAELPINTTLRQTNSGLIQDTDNEHYRGAQLNEVRAQTEFYRSRTDYYLLELQNFIRCHHECFPEIRGCGQTGCGCHSPLLTHQRSVNGIYTGRAAHNRTGLFGVDPHRRYEFITSSKKYRR